MVTTARSWLIASPTAKTLSKHFTSPTLLLHATYLPQFLLLFPGKPTNLTSCTSPHSGHLAFSISHWDIDPKERVM
jgi:hypothetical protein